VRCFRSVLMMALAIVLASSCGGPQEAPSADPIQGSVRSHSKVEVQWEEDWEAAFARAQSEGKPVMANFYAEWCVWCKHLETITYRDEKVAAMLAERVVPLNIDIEGKIGSLASDLGIQAPPTVVLFSAEGKELGRIPGYLPPTNFLTVVEKILNGEPVKFS